MLKRAFGISLIVFGSLVFADNSPSDNLPDLGDVTASRYSAQQEHDLGRMWLKMFRNSVKTVNDPLMQDYIEGLLYRLASHSELKDRRLETVIVDNATINAFAVPGGVVGVHNGIFLYTDNEAQLAGVLAHEIAHLSQRHFSRSMDNAKQSTIPTLAGLLAGVVLAATAGADAGIAAITATQAAALDSQLRFSRQHEQEADRLGMETLSKANMDPNGIPSMFVNMNANRRYARSKPPEFLLTHPLTDSRISDSANRARQYPRQVYTDNLNFQLMRMRATLQHSKNPEDLLKNWQNDSGVNGEARRYGVVIALIALNRWQEADEQLAALLKDDGSRIAYQLAKADILVGQKRYSDAIRLLQSQLAIAPNNNPYTVKLAEVLQLDNQFDEADKVLSLQSRQRPNDPNLWYQLAEVRGLAGNILGVHMARAEYFILQAQFERAKMQLRYAYELTVSNKIQQGRIKQRLRDITDMEEKLKNL
ncbi:putative Zn-dependent protease [Zhongshania antarctica]|uniref:Putative beta-barrel assembly-enhancing protease n=1 Tax=Zhongshania antarctica TaxID=641702 RepID=A0A840QZT3_9GAMM|nr:M48 family metalloprotease [Zhongshania antarctica]MBB5185967.1 putative Zn-dependent protease [Zhongshania antarctica]